MVRIALFILLFTIVGTCTAQTIYSKAFGDAKSEPIIFLHGGPGYNCASFEASTAQKLADQGFYVIVYDRRGEGRSKDLDAKFTFKQTDEDLELLYKKYKVKKATLVGHSFGGIVAVKFAEEHQKKVNAIILVGAPVSLQNTFKTIIATSKKIYQEKNDTTYLTYIEMLEEMDTTTSAYSSYCFMHAMQNGFYSPKKPTEDGANLYKQLSVDSLMTKYGSKMTMAPPQGFWMNESYTTIDLSTSIAQLVSNKLNIYGLYGKDDGLYAPDAISSLESLIGKENVQYLDQCAHSVYIDRQQLFLATLKSWLIK